MASIIDGEATLSHGAQDIDDCIDDVASASGTFESLAERVNSIDGRVEDLEEGGGGGGTTDYEQLSNQPQINGVTLQGNKTASALGLQAEIGSSSKLSSDFVTDINATNKFVTSAEKSTWNGKQDAISDLSTIRSGAAAGATAVQPTDMNTALAAKQDTLTFDTVPTENSTNPVTSGGVAASQAAQDAEIAWNVNQGVKNLIELSPNTYTSGNVIVKLNDDGTVSVSLSSGSTANTVFSRAIKTITNLRDMDLILNGCPSGGNYSNGYALYISDDGTTKEKDEGNGVLVPKNTTVTTSYLALIVRSGTAISGTLTFKPMLRPASITDSTYVPYALPNPTLTPAVIKAVDEGAKNIVHTQDITRQGKGYTATPNGDGTYTVTGSRTDTGSVWIEVADVSAEAGNYMLSGGVTGIPVAISVGDSVVYAESIAKEINAEISNKLYIHIPSGFNQSNINYVIKPMICTAADYAISPAFVPYRPSWQKLYEMVLALQSGGASTQSVQPTLMSAAKPMIETTETTELEGDEEK